MTRSLPALLGSRPAAAALVLAPGSRWPPASGRRHRRRLPARRSTTPPATPGARASTSRPRPCATSTTGWSWRSPWTRRSEATWSSAPTPGTRPGCAWSASTARTATPAASLSPARSATVATAGRAASPAAAFACAGTGRGDRTPGHAGALPGPRSVRRAAIRRPDRTRVRHRLGSGRRRRVAVGHARLSRPCVSGSAPSWRWSGCSRSSCRRRPAAALPRPGTGVLALDWGDLDRTLRPRTATTW